MDMFVFRMQRFKIPLLFRLLLLAQAGGHMQRKWAWSLYGMVVSILRVNVNIKINFFKQSAYISTNKSLLGKMNIFNRGFNPASGKRDSHSFRFSSL